MKSYNVRVWLNDKRSNNNIMAATPYSALNKIQKAPIGFHWEEGILFRGRCVKSICDSNFYKDAAIIKEKNNIYYHRDGTCVL